MRRALVARVVRVGLYAAILLASANAAGQSAGPTDEATRLAARQLAQEGLELLQAGKYAEAQDRLHRAYEIVEAPTVALLEGRAYEGMGKLVEAAERYEFVRHIKLDDASPEAFRRASEEAGAALDRLRAKIPQITVTLEGIGHATPGFELRVDGVLLPAALLGAKRPANPGSHEIVAILDGKVVERREIELSAGDHEVVEFRFEDRKPVSPPPPPPAVDQTEDPFPYRTAAWVSFGVGGAALMTGLVSLVIQIDTKKTLDEHCENEVCDPEYQDDLDRWRLARTVTPVGVVLGAVGVGTGLLMLHLGEDAAQTSSATETVRARPGTERGVEAWVGLGQIGLRGRF